MLNLKRLNRLQMIVLILMGLMLLAALVVLLLLVLTARPASVTPVLPQSSPTWSPLQVLTPELTSAVETPTDTKVIPSPTPVAVSADVQFVRQVADMGAVVSALRALPWRRELAFDLVRDDEMVAYLRDFVDQTTLHSQNSLMAALDLLPHEDQSMPPNVHSRVRTLVGFYVPGHDLVFVGSRGRNPDVVDLSFVHQYVHALQDQHFDLNALTQDLPNADMARARDALIEGDATLVMALVAYSQNTGLPVEQVVESPELIAEASRDLDELVDHLNQVELTNYESYPSSLSIYPVLDFPYSEGALFVSALLQSGWWTAVNMAYTDPPASTEQILHPAKYINAPQDAPRLVTLPDLGEGLGEDWEQVEQGVLGELVLRTHLDKYLDVEQAQEAASGWDGDLAALWRSQQEPQREVLVIRSVWDSQIEASQFVSAYTELVRVKLGDVQPVIRSIAPAGSHWWRGQDSEAYLYRQGTSILIIWAPDMTTMEALLALFYGADEP